VEVSWELLDLHGVAEKAQEFAAAFDSAEDAVPDPENLMA